ncbi:MAG: hypothetical protein KF773_15905 [Deltaproteobacteria bacterium]|nr:hypothetical protein [Deltaproteobacteria bacterium]
MSHHDQKPSAPPADPFATIDLGTLDQVAGGAGDGGLGDMMMPMMMMSMMRGRQAAPAPAAPEPWRPKVMLNGVEQAYTGNNIAFGSGGDGADT